MRGLKTKLQEQTQEWGSSERCHKARGCLGVKGLGQHRGSKEEKLPERGLIFERKLRKDRRTKDKLPVL